MNPRRIYIAGHINGQQAKLCAQKFKDAEMAIINLGFCAQNPFRLVGDINKSRKAENKTIWSYQQNKEEILRTRLRAMLLCGGVLLLPDWEQCKDAQREKAIAKLFEIPIYNSIDDLKEKLTDDTAIKH